MIINDIMDDLFDELYWQLKKLRKKPPIKCGFCKKSGFSEECEISFEQRHMYYHCVVCKKYACCICEDKCLITFGDKPGGETFCYDFCIFSEGYLRILPKDIQQLVLEYLKPKRKNR